MLIGPRTAASQELHAAKYRQRGESFDDYCVRYARTTMDDEQHFRGMIHGVRTQAILPGGRQQRAVGWPFVTTAFSCFVGGTIPDDTRGIGDALTDSMMTLRSGGGCGWDFSPIRPYGEPVRSLGDDAYASGPVSFMGMWNAMCGTIRSAGERRGAMMGVLRVDHPDIMTFIRAKENQTSLTNFNISVGVTDPFMEAVFSDSLFPLQWGGRKFKDVRALDVWSVIMENNWDWAEPGILFIDRINRMNPLWYCETIAATNPCSEQPLPPDGACLLLSHNIVKYLTGRWRNAHSYAVDLEQIRHDVNLSVRACDNVFEKTIYPLPAQKREALAKRRMGIGVTGLANALEICGHPYGTPAYIEAQNQVLETVRDAAYETSIELAKIKGPFPLFDADRWLASGFAQTLPEHLRWQIKKYGLRNGLLLSIAPTGTISLTADNVSSGLEPPPVIEGERLVNCHEGQRKISFNDYAFEEYGVRCRTGPECSPSEHVKVLCAAQQYVDSSISKTINFRGIKSGDLSGAPGISFNDFKNIYREAYDGGAKGCSTFNQSGKRVGIIRDRNEAQESCFIDEHGSKVCG